MMNAECGMLNGEWQRKRPRLSRDGSPIPRPPSPVPRPLRPGVSILEVMFAILVTTIGLLTVVICRMPLSNAPTWKPRTPLAASSETMYAPSGPSIVRCACGALVNANGTC